MSNKKLFVIILSAVILSSVVSLGAYKIFTKNSVPPSVIGNQNYDMVVDSIDYSENLLDSNSVYKKKFDNDLSSQGKWIPVKSTSIIKELTQDPATDSPEIQNINNNQTTPSETTILSKNISPVDNDETFEEEVSATNLTSNNITPVKEVTETKTVEKIIYIWQPNECNDRSWNPYTNGHWEFTCAGWVWASDYRWGNHCYNYGRWMWTSFAGWVWMPGGRWAPNWVTWRYCGNYSGGSYYGWYPTTPRLYWRDYQSHLVVCNSHFTSHPQNWTVVSTTNITKTINNTTKVDPVKNVDILKNSGKVKVINTLAIDNQKIRYNGPNVNEVSNVTKSTITPKYIEVPVTKSEQNSAGTQQEGSTDPVKVKQPKKTEETNPVKHNVNFTKTEGSSAVTSGTNPIINVKPSVTNETNPVKTTVPPVNTTKTDKVKNDPPVVKSGTTTKTNTTKTQTPKQEPTVKQNPPVKQTPPTVKQDPPKNDPPKYDPPKYNPPPIKQAPPPPVKQDPPPPPPVKQDPPKQDPPKQDPPKQDPPKKDDGKKGD